MREFTLDFEIEKTEMPLFATGWNPISWSGTFGKLVIGKAQAVEHAKASSLETQLMGAWSDDVGWSSFQTTHETQRGAIISSDWGADTQKHCVSFNSSFFTKFNNLASTAIAKWRDIARLHAFHGLFELPTRGINTKAATSKPLSLMLPLPWPFDLRFQATTVCETKVVAPTMT